MLMTPPAAPTCGEFEIRRALRHRNLRNVLRVDIFLRVERIVAGVVDRHAFDRQPDMVRIEAANANIAAVEADVVGARLDDARQQVDHLIGVGGRRQLVDRVARHRRAGLGRILFDHVAAAEVLAVDAARRHALALTRSLRLNRSEIGRRGRQPRFGERNAPLRGRVAGAGALCASAAPDKATPLISAAAKRRKYIFSPRFCYRVKIRSVRSPRSRAPTATRSRNKERSRAPPYRGSTNRSST